MKQVIILLLSALLLGLTSCKTAEEDDGEYQSPVPVIPTKTETDTVSSHVNVTYISASQVITIATEQWADGIISCNNESEKVFVESAISGIRLNFQMTGVTHIEVESVDGYGIAGSKDKSIITYKAPDGSTFTAGKDYIVSTFPCDLYSGYRLSIFKDEKAAHYFGVHQVTEAGKYITPLDLDESELEFDDPNAPLVEEERPELDKKTKELLRIYKQNPTDENYQALYDQMGVRYANVGFRVVRVD